VSLLPVPLEWFDHTADTPSTVVGVGLGLETTLVAVAESSHIDPILIAVLAFTVVELLLRGQACVSDILDELVCDL
jgi:hypothetical protein